MYGENYGYMSSLNRSMVDHLRQITEFMEQTAGLNSGDVVLDIGSNDGTLLSLYQTPGVLRVGMDPTIVKYKDLYPEDALAVEGFFSAQAFRAACPGKKAKIVTTIAMLYDLPDPAGFAQEVREVLSADGFWHIEVSYGPWMLETGAFDAVCHEHVEYYSLHTLKRILDSAGFKIATIGFNKTNGGSISITCTPQENDRVEEASSSVELVLLEESKNASNELSGWESFDRLAKLRISSLEKFLTLAKSEGKKVVGLGASTKGNVLLQSLSSEALAAIEVIGEVNSFKFGKFTPGTKIPIAPEDEVIGSNPDYVVVLPWHFRDSFENRLKDFVETGGRIVFPLPDFEVSGSEND
jgi:hypothetical protein